MNFPKIVTLHFALFVSSGLLAQDCLRVHIEDAIKVNRHRKHLYSQLTNGKSKKISNTLIFLEKTTLLVNKISGYDRKANYFNEYGIPVLCQDLLPMEDIRQFNTDPFYPTQSFSTVKKYSYLNVYRPFRRPLRSRDFKQIEQEAQKLLDGIPEGYYCMLKHILETVKVMASHTPKYIQDAKHQNLKSPRKLMLKLITTQLDTVKLILPLDRWSGPLQEKGIGILCNDVPHLKE